MKVDASTVLFFRDQPEDVVVYIFTSNRQIWDAKTMVPNI